MRGRGAVRRLLHRRLRPQRAHARAGPGGRGPPTLHAGAAFHKSTSSSPTGGGSGPWKLSSLPCFLPTEQKSRVKTRPGAGRAPTVMYLTSSFRFSPHRLFFFFLLM